VTSRAILEEDLARAEWLLLYAKACLELVGSDAWKTIDASLYSEEQATTEKWIANKVTTEIVEQRTETGSREKRLTRALTEVEAAELRAGIKVIRFLRGLPHAKADQLAAHEREITRLRKCLASEQNAKPQMDPGLKGFIQDIHDSLGATR